VEELKEGVSGREDFFLPCAKSYGAREKMEGKSQQKREGKALPFGRFAGRKGKQDDQTLRGYGKRGRNMKKKGKKGLSFFKKSPSSGRHILLGNPFKNRGGDSKKTKVSEDDRG